MRQPSPDLSPPLPVKAIFLALCCVGLFLLGCSLYPLQLMGVNRLSQKAPFYSYFILHGAAQSALGRGKLSSEEVKNLLHADEAAKQNLVNKAFEGKMEKSLLHYELAIHPE